MNSMIIPFLDAHMKSYELKDGKEKSFEHLINYITTRNYTSRHFDPDDISIGKGEVGIDGIAIIVNDTLIIDMDQIEEFFSKSKEISVEFVFTQSKTSESFSLEALSHFFNAVNDFLKDGNIQMNEKASKMHKICNYIMQNPTQLTKNPDCHLFYAFTGHGSDNEQREAVINNQIKLLRQTSQYDEITFSLYDCMKIVNVCRSIKSSIKKTIDMIDCAVIPSIHDVSEAYIGIVKCKNFINLIVNEEGGIISNLFEDNIRYFQGKNSINAEIQSTLRDVKKQQEFSILNNGITIIAKEMRRTGNSFTLSDFQIINGCQTSFILYENRKAIQENAYVVVKLIATIDKNISDSIVRTTNRQTPILNEAFETLRDFHKNLENIYESYPKNHRLYYERRSKQYDSSDINKTKIVSFPFQTKAYVAVFLGEPQSTHRYYGELLNSYGKRMYNENDILEQYCIASIYVYVVDKFIRENEKYGDYKKYRFHIALMLRYIASDQKIPQPNSKEMKQLCVKFYQKIESEVWLKQNIEKCCDIINKLISSGDFKIMDGNDYTRSSKFTLTLIEQIGFNNEEESIIVQSLPELKKGAKVRCKVKSWNNSFVYVDLLDYKDIGSIYIKYLTGDYISNIESVIKMNQELVAKIIDDVPHPSFGYKLSII